MVVFLKSIKLNALKWNVTCYDTCWLLINSNKFSNAFTKKKKKFLLLKKKMNGNLKYNENNEEM